MKEQELAVAQPTPKNITRRDILRTASAAAVVAGLGKMAYPETTSASTPREASPETSPDNSKTFPDKFLWGSATAGYQVEGNNTNSELWMMEHLPGTIFKEPSGDACDHYHLYPQDISMLADLGFNTYRVLP
jgi:Glycosyl hydrolase family 1